MKRLGLTIIFFALLMLVSCSSDDSQTEDQDLSNESIYFPPLNSDPWETKTTAELNWNENQFQPLLDFVEEKGPRLLLSLKTVELL